MSLIDTITGIRNGLLNAFVLVGGEIKKIRQLFGNATTSQEAINALTGAASAAPGQVLRLSGGHAVFGTPPGFIGEIRTFVGTHPKGWLLCGGQLLSTTDYPELFLKISGQFGGDGTSTFGVPDMRNPSSIKSCICVSHTDADVVPVLVSVPTYIIGPQPGTYSAGAVLDFTVQLSERVTITTGPILLALNIGGATVSLTPQTIGDFTITYQYTVLAGDAGTLTAAMDLNGAALTVGGVQAWLSVNGLFSDVVIQ